MQQVKVGVKVFAALIITLGVLALLSMVSFSSGTTVGIIRTVEETPFGAANVSVVTIGLRNPTAGGITDAKYFSIPPMNEALVKQVKRAQLTGEPVVLSFKTPTISSLQVFTAHPQQITAVESQAQALNKLK